MVSYVGDGHGHNENIVLIELTAKCLIYKQAPYEVNDGPKNCCLSPISVGKFAFTLNNRFTNRIVGC